MRKVALNMHQGFFQDTSRERGVRLALLWFAMVTCAVIVVGRYRWAQPQNGGPPPRLETEILIAATPAIACIMGWLGRNLRFWSWGLVVAGVFGAYYAVARVFEDDGTAWTRAFYQETMLRVHLPLALFGVAALANVLIRSLLTGHPPNWNRMKVGFWLIPFWFFVVLGSL